MLTCVQFPAATISLFMRLMFLRKFKHYIDSASNLSINLFLQDVHSILEDISPKELPVPYISRMDRHSLDLSVHLAHALEDQIITATELQTAISLVLQAEMNKLDWEERPMAQSIITTLRDFGLSTALDSSIHQVFLLATELLSALRGE
jgi:hypothetical protein